MQERIRSVMNHYGMSQQNFALKLGLSAATISSIFTGRTKPTNNHVQAIHRAFPEVNMNWLLFGEGEMTDSAPVISSSDTYIPNVQNVGSTSVGTTSPGTAVSPDMLSFFGHETASVLPKTNAVVEHAVPAGSGYTPHGMANYAMPPNETGKPVRKIKEIRVFYDDGTFEVFSSSNSK